MEGRTEGLEDDVIIELNVGGTPYTTSLSTLLSVPETYFAGRFSGNFWALERDAQGRFFIDRDGITFRYILNYLRTHKVIIPPDSIELRLQIAEEASYFGFSDLAKEMNDQADKVLRDSKRKINQSVTESPLKHGFNTPKPPKILRPSVSVPQRFYSPFSSIGSQSPAASQPETQQNVLGEVTFDFDNENF